MNKILTFYSLYPDTLI